MSDNDHEAVVQGLLRRLDYFWDILLCNECHEEEDGVWAKGTTQEKLWWYPDTTGCPECKHLGCGLPFADDYPDGYC